MNNLQREKLAAYAHGAWSGWIRYLFDESAFKFNGSVTIPADLVLQWERQIKTPYIELSESEKDSDRAEADKMLEIVQGVANG